MTAATLVTVIGMLSMQGPDGPLCDFRRHIDHITCTRQSIPRLVLCRQRCFNQHGQLRETRRSSHPSYLIFFEDLQILANASSRERAMSGLWPTFVLSIKQTSFEPPVRATSPHSQLPSSMKIISSACPGLLSRWLLNCLMHCMEVLSRVSH